MVLVWRSPFRKFLSIWTSPKRAFDPLPSKGHCGAIFWALSIPYVQMQVQLLKGAFLNRHWCQCHDVVDLRDLMKRSHRLPLVVGQHQSPAGGVPAEDHLHYYHWNLHSGLCTHFQLFHATRNEMKSCHFCFKITLKNCHLVIDKLSKSWHISKKPGNVVTCANV